MQELSMNILDIAQNSVRAEAGLVEIEIMQDLQKRMEYLSISDNGCGMSAEMAEKVVDPFCTTRTTRRVGLGLPFLKMAAEMAGGSFSLESVLGEGTVVKASFCLDNIDLAPLGDISSTVSALVQTNPDMDFIYRFILIGENGSEEKFEFKTAEAREILEGVPLSEPAVALFIRDHIKDNMKGILNL